MFLGANTLEYESSRERMFPGQFAPGNESSREREGQGVKVPGSELARILLADSLQGSELARERKGCESTPISCLKLRSAAWVERCNAELLGDCEQTYEGEYCAPNLLRRTLLALCPT